MAAPPIILRTVNQAGSDGIQMNITNQLQKINISVTENGLIASLKDMPYSIISPVEIPSIPGMKSLQHL